MNAAISLPNDAVTILTGRQTAFQIGEALHTAYWLHGRDSSTAYYMLNEAHKALHTLAAEMGYTLVPIAASVGEEVE
jgi:hypothetical protein